jgi:cobalt/nickel transport system permease protein
MHMADALISPAVGATMWAASGGLIAYCSKKVRAELDDRKVPLMGVLGAFVFAAQMINFSIPGTGSSGHIGGGLLLAIMLGPHAAFLTIASVLVVQALFFADGGILALGCNMFNLGFFPAFLAYPFIYKKIASGPCGSMRMAVGALLAAVAGLQLGAFSVVLETFFSGISSLPLSTFLIFMQPVHLAIGIVEGVTTAGVVYFIVKARPDILDAVSFSGASLRAVAASLCIAAIIIGGVVSWFASKNPDGLEWSIARITGREELSPPATGAHTFLERLQQKIALLPEYAFKKPEDANAGQAGEAVPAKAETSLAGIIGSLLTLGAALLAGILLRRGRRKTT